MKEDLESEFLAKLRSAKNRSPPLFSLVAVAAGLADTSVLVVPEAAATAAAVSTHALPTHSFRKLIVSHLSQVQANGCPACSIIDIEDFQQYQLFLNKTAAVGNVLFFTAPNCPRCKTIEKMLVKSAKMLKKDEETKDKFKYAKIDGTKLTNTTSGGLVAAELEIPGAPAIYWFKVPPAPWVRSTRWARPSICCWSQGPYRY